MFFPIITGFLETLKANCFGGNNANNLEIKEEIKRLFDLRINQRLVLRMKDDQYRFLSLLGQLPARLTAEQSAWVLNCQPHDVPALVNARLLKPLGNPSANAVKFFATADVLENAKERAWLVKMTTTINQHWQRQNAKKCRVAVESSQGDTPLLGLPSVAVG